MKKLEIKIIALLSFVFLSCISAAAGVNTVHSITVSGLEKTSRTAFMRFIHLRPGDVFDRQVLDDDLDNLDLYGVFKDVRADVHQTGDGVDIDFKVTEQGTKAVFVLPNFNEHQGLGFATKWYEQNYKGNLQVMDVYLIGMTGIGSKLDLKGVDMKLVVKDRAVRGKALQGEYALHAYNTVRKYWHGTGYDDYSGFFTDSRIMIKARFLERLGNGRFLQYKFRTGAAAMHQRDDWIMDTVKTYPGQSSMVLMAESGLVLDRRDDLAAPTQGYYFETSGRLLWSGSLLTSQLHTDLNGYYKLPGNRHTLAGRLVMDLGGTAAFMEKFSLGGLDTLRAYQTDYLVKDNMVVSNVEWRFPVYELPDGERALTACLALDLGTAWDAGESTGHMLTGTNLSLIWTQFREIIIRFDIGRHDDILFTYFAYGYLF